MITTIDMTIGQEINLGPDVVLKLVKKQGRAAPVRVPTPPPALETMPGATRRPGPPVQRRAGKGGAS